MLLNAIENPGSVYSSAEVTYRDLMDLVICLDTHVALRIRVKHNTVGYKRKAHPPS